MFPVDNFLKSVVAEVVLLSMVAFKTLDNIKGYTLRMIRKARLVRATVDVAGFRIG